MAKGFCEKVWALVSKIPKGKVSTYSEVARAAGRPKAARAVGNALNNSPGMQMRPRGAAGNMLNAGRNLRKAPCYRVVRSNGSVGGYAKGAKRKEAMLRADGIRVKNGKILSFRTYLFKFPRR